jgi:hypothetical protein
MNPFSWPLTSEKSCSSSTGCANSFCKSTFTGAIFISPSRNCAASRRFCTGITFSPLTTAASAAFSAGHQHAGFAIGLGPQRNRQHALARTHRARQREFADDGKIFKLVGFKLLARRQHAECDGQIKARPFFFHVGGREVDGGLAHRKFVAGIGQRRGDAVLGLLDRRVRQADERDERVAVAAVDLDFDRVSVNAVDRR